MAFISALAIQTEANRPVGEGQLFAADAASARVIAGDMLGPGMGASEVVRHVRNRLKIETVAIVDVEGVYLASTSSNLLGSEVENRFLRFGLARGRLAALALELAHPLFIDGVQEWETGDTVYQVIQPFDDGSGALVLFYDISELLERRATAAGLTEETRNLLVTAAFMIGAASLLLIGRSRTRRRYREMEIESHYLRDHARDLRRINRELEAARTEAEDALTLAEEKNRIRAEFVLMINHELRTPLTAVVTGAQLLASGAELTEADREVVLNDLLADGRRLEDLIAQMLAVARIENRGLNFDLVDTSIADVCNAVRAKHPRVTHRHESAHPDVPIETDRDSLVQLLGSLIDNAFNHGATEVHLACVTQPTFDPLIEVGDRPSESMFFVVTDDGPGIDPEFLPRAFEKYEKDSFSPGTGLGLYLAAMVVKALNGSIAATSSEEGTAMAVAVPFASASVPVEVTS